MTLITDKNIKVNATAMKDFMVSMLGNSIHTNAMPFDDVTTAPLPPVVKEGSLFPRNPDSFETSRF